MIDKYLKESLPMEDSLNHSTFQFSAVSVDILEDNEYTLVNLVLDFSGSVGTYFDSLKEMVKMTIETLRDPKAPFAENILFRLITFNGSVYEEHGYLPLISVDTDGYDSLSHPVGLTALYDACLNAQEATEKYGMMLTQQDYTVNAIIIIVTDGGDNDSKRASLNDIKSFSDQLRTSESVESCRTILVACNTHIPNAKRDLSNFNTVVGFDQYIEIENATPSSMAKLAGFVSQSVSMQAQANGTGVASTSVDINF